MLRSTGLMLVVLAMGGFGCGGKDKSKDKEKSPMPVPSGPSKEAGVMILGEPGERYHIKLDIDAKGKKASAEILNDKLDAPVQIEEESITLTIKDAKPVNITLKSIAEKGKKSFKFEAVHDRLAEAVDAKKIEVTATLPETPGSEKTKQFVFEKEEHDHKH